MRRHKRVPIIHNFIHKSYSLWWFAVSIQIIWRYFNIYFLWKSVIYKLMIRNNIFLVTGNEQIAARENRWESEIDREPAGSVIYLFAYPRSRLLMTERRVRTARLCSFLMTSRKKFTMILRISCDLLLFPSDSQYKIALWNSAWLYFLLSTFRTEINEFRNPRYSFEDYGRHVC